MSIQNNIRAALGAALLLSASFVLADGRLEGRVVASDRSTMLEGARVRIEARQSGSVKWEVQF